MRISSQESEHRFLADGTTVIRGQDISYRTISEETLLDGRSGSVAASSTMIQELSIGVT